MKLKCFRLFLALFIIFIFSNLFSQTPSEISAAKNLAKAGVVLFEQGKYKDALEIFLKSYSIAKIAIVVWNIGRCYEEIGEYENSLKYFEEYLLLEKDKDKIKIAEQKIKETKGKIYGKIILNVFPDECDIFIDGKFYSKSPSPPIELKKGKYKLLFRKKMFYDEEREIEILAGKEHQIEIKLKLIPAKLIVEAEKEVGAVKIFSSDKLIYNNRLPATLEINPGMHEIKITTNDGKIIYEESMVVDAEEEKFLKIKPFLIVEKQIVEKQIIKKPFYKKWWFWIATGVVAGGITSGVILLSREKEVKRGIPDWQINFP